jgi:hypothetical protein
MLVERGVDNGTHGGSPIYVTSPLSASREQGLDGDGEATRLPTVPGKMSTAATLAMELGTGVSSYTMVKINSEGVLYHGERQKEKEHESNGEVAGDGVAAVLLSGSRWALTHKNRGTR